MRKKKLALGALLALTVAATACNASSAEDEAVETREVEHAMGVAEVPVDPQRVVVLDTGELDSALALGVKPVGAVRVDVSKDFLSYLGDQTDGIEMVGTITEPNLEKIAAVNPDLILTSTVRHEAIYDQLNAIAPTVMAPDLGDTWKQNLRLYAEALNKSDEAEKLIADYEQRAAEVGDQLGAGKTLALVRFLPGEIRLYSDLSFSGTVLADMGLKVPAPARGEDTFLALSPEQVTKANADFMYVSNYGPAEDTERAKVTGGPLWKTIPAVKSGEVNELNDDLVSGISIQAANQLLDRFEQDLG